MKTISCFIRKNTPELRKDLSNLGYIYGGSVNIDIHQPHIFCSAGKYFECTHKPSRDYCIIDCEDSEELFLAILSLSDLSDKNQWFISEKGDFEICSGNTFDPYNEGLSLEDCKLQWHKASIEELIKHFRDNKNMIDINFCRGKDCNIKEHCKRYLIGLHYLDDKSSQRWLDSCGEDRNLYLDDEK